jgi:hypothetical protein
MYLNPFSATYNTSRLETLALLTQIFVVFENINERNIKLFFRGFRAAEFIRYHKYRLRNVGSFASKEMVRQSFGLFIY